MLFKHIWDLTVGRLILPRRDTEVGIVAGELVQIAGRLFFRTVDNLNTWEILTTRNAGQPGGPAILGADGKLPFELIPESAGGNGAAGQLVLWLGDPTTAPTDCLFCDGDEYLRSEFPELFAVLRCRAGRPTDDRFFRVPDYRGVMPLGAHIGAGARTGAVMAIDVVTRGRDYTPGTHAFTSTGGTGPTSMAGSIVVVNELVPGVGVVGVVQSIILSTPGSYTDYGTKDPGSPSNCGIEIVCPGLAGGTGFTYDIVMAPVADRYGIAVTNKGAGYVTPPTVAIVGPLGAQAYPIMDGGTVREVVITNPGTGTWVGATVTFTGGAPSTAATAAVELQEGAVGVGYRGGERGHTQTDGELARHRHSAPKESGHSRRERDGGTGVEGMGNTGYQGDGFKTATAPAWQGCGIYIRSR
jgi:hypothetical protein